MHTSYDNHLQESNSESIYNDFTIKAVAALSDLKDQIWGKTQLVDIPFFEAYYRQHKNDSSSLWSSRSSWSNRLQPGIAFFQ